MAELSMTFHTEVVGSQWSAAGHVHRAHRRPGRGDPRQLRVRADDVMIVFSASGRSAVPIEIAMGARDRGLQVAAVTSVRESMAGPATHSSGTRLLDHADVVDRHRDPTR